MPSTALATLDDDDVYAAELADADVLDLVFDRVALEGSLFAFVQAAWPIVELTNPFVSNWHIQELCHVLEEVFYVQDGRLTHALPASPLRRLIVNIPPGTMKSLLIEVFWPAWVWAKDAKKRFMFASYGAHLTTRDNLRCRQIIESVWYQERWPVKLLDDQNTKTRYNTTKHGWRVATSIGGVGTGEHPDFIVIDDPTSAEQAESTLERTSANDWFDSTISTRLGRSPAMIVVMQRLHEEDMSGHLLKRGDWTLIRWPMRYEKCACVGGVMDPDENTRCSLHKADPTWAKDTRDPRTVSGELLFPALFPEAKVRGIELDLGPYGTAGQLQQRPSPEGGGLFKREYFKFVDKAPALLRVARGWDTAATEGGGDYCCGVLIGEEFEWIHQRELKSTGLFYVIDVQHDQLGPDALDKLIKVTAELDRQTYKQCAQREEREPGSSGKIVTTARAKTLKGFDYAEVLVSGSKTVRAKPFRAQCEAGNVFLVRAPWNELYIRELCGFPNAKHDDQVDGSSTAFNAVLLEEPPKKHSITW